MTKIKYLSLIVFALLPFVISDADAKETSPYHQFKNNISSNDIVCSDDRVLVLKSSNNMPACIYSESIQTLTERGWIGNIIKIDPQVMSAIEAASIKKYALEPEFEVQRNIAKQIYKDLRLIDDTRYISLKLGDDRKSLDFYVDNTNFTPEKNQQYYENIIDEAFTKLTIPVNVIFVEASSRGAGDE